jgi:hypothetical protein
MIRLACLFALLAIAALVVLIVNLNGATATLFSFVGIPSLGLALTLYGIERWRAGAYRLHPKSHRDDIRAG